MKWIDILEKWTNGEFFKYPNSIKNKFLWNTSIIKNNGDCKFEQRFKVDTSLPSQEDYTSFQKFINKSKNKSVLSFNNLSGDTILVIPKPKANKNFATIKDFCDNASDTQQKEFWKKVSSIIKKELKNGNEIYVSTHGHGVYFLHVRISKYPKYYFSKHLLSNN